MCANSRILTNFIQTQNADPRRLEHTAYI